MTDQSGQPDDGEFEEFITVDAKALLKRWKEEAAAKAAAGREGARAEEPAVDVPEPEPLVESPTPQGLLPQRREPLMLGLLARVERERAAMGCTAHSTCGPVTRTGASGHGHGPNPATGQWCWHFDRRWIGRPDETPPEGSNLAARRAREAARPTAGPWRARRWP